MLVFGFDTSIGFLSHALRFNVEWNTYFNWLSYTLFYSEEDNSIRLILEFCKIQLFVAVSSNIQDLYNFCPNSYFLRQNHEPIDIQQEYNAQVYESEE